MKDILKKLKANYVTTGIIYVILGLLLLLIPGTIQDTISLILGLAIVAMGVFNLVLYFATLDSFIWYQSDFLLGIIEVVFGLFIITNPRILISFIPLIFGLILLVHGINGIIQAMSLRKYENIRWVSSVVLNIISMVLGFVIMLNPFGTIELLLRIIGICLIYSGINDFIAAYKSKKAFDSVTRNPMDGSIDGYVDADFREIK